jgi:hypothetical protein
MKLFFILGDKLFWRYVFLLGGILAKELYIIIRG